MSRENNVRRSGRARQTKRLLSPTPPPSRPSSSARKTESRTPSLPLTDTPSTSACPSRSGSRLPDIPPIEEDDEELPQIDENGRIYFPPYMRRFCGAKLYRLMDRAREKYGITGKGKRRRPITKRKHSKTRAVRIEMVEKAVPVEKEGGDEDGDYPPLDVTQPDEPEYAEDDASTAEEPDSDFEDEVIKKARLHFERDNDFEAAISNIDPTLIAGGSRRKIIPKKRFSPPPQVSTFSNINEADLEMEEVSVEVNDLRLQDVREGSPHSSRSLSVEILDPVGEIPEPAALEPIPQSIRRSVAPKPVQRAASQPHRQSVAPPAPSNNQIPADDDDDDIQVIKVVNRPRQPMSRGPRPIISRYSQYVAPPPPSQVTYRASDVYVSREMAKESALKRGGRLVDTRHHELVFTDCASLRPRVHVLSHDQKSEHIYVAESQHFINAVRFNCINPHTNRTFLEMVADDDGSICAYEFGQHNDGCRRPRQEIVPDEILITKVRSQLLLFVKTLHLCDISADKTILRVPTGNVIYEFRYCMYTSKGHIFTATCGCPAQARMTEDLLYVNYTHNPTCEKFKLAQAYADTGVTERREAVDVEEVPGPSNRRSAPRWEVPAAEIPGPSNAVMAYRQEAPGDQIPGPSRRRSAPFREIPADEVPGPSNAIVQPHRQEEPIPTAASLNLPSNPANIAWLNALSEKHSLRVETQLAYTYWDRIKPDRDLQSQNLVVWDQGQLELEVILAKLLLGDSSLSRDLIGYYKQQFASNFHILEKWSQRDYRQVDPKDPHITRIINSKCTKTLLQFIALHAGFRVIVFQGNGSERHAYGNWKTWKSPLAALKKRPDIEEYDVVLGVTDESWF